MRELSRWESVRLGDVCEVVSGTTPSTGDPHLWDGNIKWITPAELQDDSYFISDTQRYISSGAKLKPMPAGTVLLSSRAPIGKVAIAGVEMCCNQGFKNLVCSDAIHNQYLYRFLKGKTAYLNDLGRGATFKEISKPIVEDVCIPLPPLSTQRAIAATLDQAAALIAMRRRQIEKLELLVQARFVELFGDPVRNERAWEVKRLGMICDVRDGTHDSPEYVFSGYPLITSKNVSAGHIDFTGVNQIAKADFDLINRRSKVDRGDIIMPMIGTIGNPVIVETEREFAIKNVALIKFNSGEIINTYLISLLRLDYFSYVTSRSNRGGTQKFIALSDIRGLPIPLPPLPLQQAFAQFVSQAESQKQTLKQAQAKLQMQYDALMQEYFGQGDKTHDYR